MGNPGVSITFPDEMQTAISGFINGAHLLDGIESVELSVVLQPIIDAASAIEGVDPTTRGLRDALEASGCALEGIDVPAINQFFDVGATATGASVDFDLINFTATAQTIQDAGVRVLAGIDHQDVNGAIAGLSDAARAVQAFAIQAQTAVRYLPAPASIQSPAIVPENSRKTSLPLA